MESNHAPFQPLIDALMATKNKVCIALAKKLADNCYDTPTFSLHLRTADLTSSQLKLITNSLCQLPPAAKSALTSLSLSYNSDLSDDDIVNLMDQLPKSVRELGLVGCDLDDLAAKAILDWAFNNPNISMLCIENNNFSQHMRREILKLKNKLPQLFIQI